MKILIISDSENTKIYKILLELLKNISDYSDMTSEIIFKSIDELDPFLSIITDRFS
jgi:hypothetical protein